MVQEGALWPSVMITFGPHWQRVKLLMLYIASCMAVLKLYCI